DHKFGYISTYLFLSIDIIHTTFLRTCVETARCGLRLDMYSVTFLRHCNVVCAAIWYFTQLHFANIASSQTVSLVANVFSYKFRFPAPFPMEIECFYPLSPELDLHRTFRLSASRAFPRSALSRRRPLTILRCPMNAPVPTSIQKLRAK